MTHDMDVNVHDNATAFVAQTQIFHNGDDFIEIQSVDADDLRACADGTFVTPTGEWASSADKLVHERLLVLVGERGSGRRTAALRQLCQVCGADQRIYELEPVWSRPRAKLLPPGTHGCGYLLDLSEPTKERPGDEFGRQLLTWAREQGVFLVVTTTREVWNGRWTAGARSSVARIGSPDARRLVETELRVAGVPERTLLLQDAAFAPIWKSRPKAEDACRLAKIIATAADPDPAQIVAEYRNWQTWIDAEMPADLGPRTLLWACAFCDGGRRKSILRMSEELRRKLGDDRTPAKILGDLPASKRLEEAKIERDGDRVRLAPDRHGLPAAVRRHLWDEYEDQVDILKDWVLEQVATLDTEDADRVVDALLDLVIQYRDDELLRRLRDTLTGEKRPLAVRALSRAALDPRFGAHVRGRLYTWLASSPSQETIDVVAEVCAGPFGVEKPDMALVRLRLAAQKTRPGSQALSDAFTNLATHHPDQVLKAIREWSDKPNSRKAGTNAFLALATQENGLKILYGEGRDRIADPEYRRELASYLDAALGDPATSQTTNAVMDTWAALAEEGWLDEEATVDIFARALAPKMRDGAVQRFLLNNAQTGLDTFWGRVLTLALKGVTETDTDVLAD